MARRGWRALHQQLKRNKRNATCGDVENLLGAAGWTMDRQSGSHCTYVKAGCPPIITVTCKDGHVRIGQVAELLRTIEECADDDPAE